MIQVNSITIPADSQILKARTERSKVSAASFNLHQAISYYLSWKPHTGQPEAQEHAKKLLLQQCNTFAELTYNNPYAGKFIQDIKLCFYYHNELTQDQPTSKTDLEECDAPGAQ